MSVKREHISHGKPCSDRAGETYRCPKLNVWLLTGIEVLLLLIFSYALQLYQFTELEESFPMVYDCDYLGAVLVRPGGFAQIVGSLFTQFFICRWAGPLIVCAIYVVIIWQLAAIAYRCRSALWLYALAWLPCLCLLLCLENSAFMFKGIVAVALNVIALSAYCRRDSVAWMRVVEGCLLSLLMYYLTGAVALVFAVSALAFDLLMRKRLWWCASAYLALTLLFGYICYLTGVVPTIEQVYTPVAYYDMGSTYFMMLYVMAAVVVYIVAVAFTHDYKAQTTTRQWIYAGVVVIVCLSASWRVYALIHSSSNYRVQHERYLARHGDWAAIASLPYDGSPTPYTSYRFLALAKQGRLVDCIADYHPFISYLIENKPKVKKRDQQVYSDIYYECDYLAAARHSAFDTDIVNPGAFNPYETQKLVMINLAFGDYGVAEKLIGKLEKTLFYADWAKDKRTFLYNDKAVEDDPVLGRMRRAIPVVNDYMSPKGIVRDLKAISDNDSTQVAAEQMYRAFMLLVSQL